MPRFIPLSIFRELYKDQSELLDENNRSAFIERLKGVDGNQVAHNHSISVFDLNHFIESLQDPQLIVYHGWVDQNEPLMNLLFHGKAEEAFTDVKSHLQHGWAPQYKKFLSSYLANRLLSVSTDSMEELSIYFSYVVLLDDVNRPLVEEHLFKKIKEKLNALDEAGVVDSEQELINLIRPICADEIISCVNNLSKSSYIHKLNYVDSILNAMRSNGCTVRLANWILKQMSRIELNNEHQYKLVDLRKDLREGRLEVRNHGKGRTPIRWKNMIAILFIMILVGSVYYIIAYEPFSKVEDDIVETGSSFKEFSKEDRKAIDSLLKEMSGDYSTNGIEIDPGFTTGGPDAIQLRTEYKNSLMERIYSDVNRDATLKEYYASDSCRSNAEFKRYPGVKNLAKKSGKIDVVLRNESEYDIIIYVCSSSSGGDVHSSLLTPNETITFKMNRLDILTTVAGNSFSKYQVPKNLTEEDKAPSLAFEHHFCDTDANYFESLNAPVQLKWSKNNKAKFMVMGDQNGYYRLIDIYGVTDPY